MGLPRSLPPVPLAFCLLSLALLLTAPLLADRPAVLLTAAGASGGFLSLAHLSRNLRWDREAPRLVAWLGGVFLLGLLFLGSLAASESSGWTVHGVSYRLVLLVLGIYLCLFSTFAVQGVLNGLGTLASFVGVLLLFAGGVLALVGWLEYRIVREFRPEPQTISLAELLAKGHGDNRHVRLTHFRHCNERFRERSAGTEELRLDYYWVPVVPADTPTPEGSNFTTPPARVVALVEERELQGGTQSRTTEEVRRQRERQGYQGTLKTGLISPSESALSELRKIAPETDTATVVILTADKPPPAYAYWWLIGGLAGTVIGLGLVALAFHKAWLASRRLAASLAAQPEVSPA